VSGSGAVSGLNRLLTIRSNLTIHVLTVNRNPHSAVNFQLSNSNIDYVNHYNIDVQFYILLCSMSVEYFVSRIGTGITT